MKCKFEDFFPKRDLTGVNLVLNGVFLKVTSQDTWNKISLGPP